MSGSNKSPGRNREIKPRVVFGVVLFHSSTLGGDGASYFFSHFFHFDALHTTKYFNPEL